MHEKIFMDLSTMQVKQNAAFFNGLDYPDCDQSFYFDSPVNNIIHKEVSVIEDIAISYSERSLFTNRTYIRSKT